MLSNQNEAREASACSEGSGVFGGLSFREEWLHKWGFRYEDPEQTEGMLYGLSGDFEKHRPRSSNNCFEQMSLNGVWEGLSPKQKLILVLEFHTRVAPFDWWRDYFIRLDRSAYTESLPCFHHSKCTCFTLPTES